jgi:hypothetical protein
MKASIAGLALGALTVAPMLLVPASAAVVTGPKHVHRVFDIMRAGSRIGTDTFDITRQGDTTTVKIDTKIVVKIAFITAYRYTHSESESWKGKQLVAFASTTDDNGTNHDVRATQAGGKLAMVVDGVSSTAPKSLMPASLWSADVSKGPQLFDPANGKKMAVQAQDLGPEDVKVNGAPQQLDHVKLSGAFPRDLWFDDQGLVKMTLLGSDNSEVTSQLRQSTASR